MGHLRKGLGGHLMKGAGGHLLRDSCCCGEITCDACNDWPCWPCNRRHYRYSVSMTVHVQNYSDNACTPGNETTSYTGTLTNVVMYATGYGCEWSRLSVPVSWTPSNPLGSDSASLWYTPSTKTWQVSYYQIDPGFGCGGTKTPGGAVGSYTPDTPTCAATGASTSHKIWATDVSITAQFDPTWLDFTDAGVMSTVCAAGTWSLSVWSDYISTTSKADYCTRSGLPTCRHLKFGAQEYWCNPASLFGSWTFSRSWTSGEYSYAAGGYGWDLTSPVPLSITGTHHDPDGIYEWIPSCTYYAGQCTPPALDIDEVLTCP